MAQRLQTFQHADALDTLLTLLVVLSTELQLLRFRQRERGASFEPPHASDVVHLFATNDRGDATPCTKSPDEANPQARLPFASRDATQHTPGWDPAPAPLLTKPEV